MKHIVSISDLGRDDLKKLVEQSAKAKKMLPIGTNDLSGKVIASVFLEPSTRTRLSFEAAVARSGGQCITVSGGQFSSISKGETLEDTIKVISQYADAVVLRQSENDGAVRAAGVSACPVINAGAGSAEHPTQAVLDLFTIAERFDVFSAGVKIAFVGDLKYGRTVLSLAQVLQTIGGAQVALVAPDELAMPKKYTTGAEQTHHQLTPEVLAWADVVYMTRVQKERFNSSEAYNAVKDSCILTHELAQNMRPDAMILHPLPRVNEVETNIDTMPQAHYFTQAANGVPVRMALINWALS